LNTSSDTNVKISNFIDKKRGLVEGLVFTVINGTGSYFADDVNLTSVFEKNGAWLKKGISSKFGNKTIATAGVIPNSDAMEIYTVEWFGYFYTKSNRFVYF